VAAQVLPGRRLEVAETGRASVVEDDVEEGTLDTQAAMVVEEAQLSELIAPRHAIPDWRATPLGLSLGGHWSVRRTRLPFREKLIDSPRMWADSCGTWNPIEFSASMKSR